LRRLAAELCAQGHQISHTVVGELLKSLHFSLQANSKTREGDSHPDRDAQFRYIDRLANRALKTHQPVISVDTKKKELVGDFKNGGREWRPQPTNRPVELSDHESMRGGDSRRAPRQGDCHTGRVGSRRDRRGIREPRPGRCTDRFAP
jgi:hypothetical protein